MSSHKDAAFIGLTISRVKFDLNFENVTGDFTFSYLKKALCAAASLCC